MRRHGQHKSCRVFGGRTPTVLQRRRRPVELRVLVAHDEHRHARAVLAGIPHLFRGKVVRAKTRDLRRTIYAPPLSLSRFVEVILPHKARRCKAREGREVPRLRTAAADRCGSDKVPCYTLKAFAGRQLIDIDLVDDLSSRFVRKMRRMDSRFV